MKPATYRIQNCCANCRHVFFAPTNTPRLALSYCAYDSPFPDTTELFLNAQEQGNLSALFQWRKWSEDREVNENGLCEQWQWQREK